MIAAIHTPGHDLAPRVVRTAALLAERYQNPDVAAYNRSRGGARHSCGRYIVAPSTPRRELFWFNVGRALGAAYGRRGCRSDYDIAVRRDIDAARCAIATGVPA